MQMMTGTKVHLLPCTPLTAFLSSYIFSGSRCVAHPQGSVMEIIGRTYERGGLLAFFSGNEAGAAVTQTPLQDFETPAA